MTLERRTPLRKGKPLRRTPLQAGRTPARRTPVKPRSEKRGTGSRVPAGVVAEVDARSGLWCEWCLTGGVRRDGTELHHRLPRSRGGPDDAFNLVRVCGTHHRRAHAENLAPWLVFGRILRGVYTGPDDAYADHYRAA